MQAGADPTLEWTSDTRLAVDGVDFVLAPSEPDLMRIAADSGAMLLRKARWMVECYQSLDVAPGLNLFEIGIYQGGSAALLALLLRPRRLAAIDLTAQRATALDDFSDAHGLADVVHPHYGIDQADRARVETIVAEEFGTELLDVVIDDGSHLLEPTKASFNVLFPRLRAGGLYVIEDWSWDHLAESIITSRLRDDPAARAEWARMVESGEAAAPIAVPLSRLVLELVLTAAFDGGIVSEIVNAREGWLVVRRGDSPLDPKSFDISNCYGTGRGLLA
jgi:predicted O-methyltransferase YrrM